MPPQPFTRRSFLRLSATAMAGAPLLGAWLPASAAGMAHANPADMAIQDVLNLIIAACGEPIKDTVDTAKSGDPSQPLKGIVSTFMATAEVIQKAANLGANLIITHEPTFYNHFDEVDWLEKDPVYQFKRRLLEENGIVVWRFHDYWHQHRPDGILQGFLERVGWEQYLAPDRKNTCLIPPTTLAELSAFFKAKLGLRRPFYVGDKDLACSNVGLLLGAWGGRPQISMLSQEDIDVLVVGEVAEWETCEYVRDAAFAGIPKGLLILGHAESEEPGMDYLLQWLRPRIPEAVPIYHIAAEDPFVGI